jgi:hypothetical protein
MIRIIGICNDLIWIFLIGRCLKKIKSPHFNQNEGISLKHSYFFSAAFAFAFAKSPAITIEIFS